MAQGTEKPRVLILCTGNSARSQMAEGILRHLSQGALDVASAGTHPSFVHPLAIQAMREAGIDISGHRSKSMEEFAGQKFDAVITVCDRAAENCPVFSGAPERIHFSLEDPAAVSGSEEERLRAFLRIRDALFERLRRFQANHPAGASA
jgi:arsenate reductase